MAKLKADIELKPYGENSTPFKGEVADDVAAYLIESGKACEDDFEELPNVQSTTLSEMKEALKNAGVQFKGNASKKVIEELFNGLPKTEPDQSEIKTDYLSSEEVSEETIEE